MGAALAALIPPLIESITSLLEGAGFIISSITLYESVPLATLAANAALFEAAVNTQAITYSLTALGAYTLAFLGTAAIIGASVGIVLGATSASSIQDQPSVIDKFITLEPLIKRLTDLPTITCLIADKDNECGPRRLSSSVRQSSEMRLSSGEGIQRTMLPSSTSSRLRRSRRINVHPKRQASKSRGVPVKKKRLRR